MEDMVLKKLIVCQDWSTNNKQQTTNENQLLTQINAEEIKSV